MGKASILRKRENIVGLLRLIAVCNRETIFGHGFTYIDRELSAEIAFTSSQTADLAKRNLAHLKKLFSAGFELTRCTINEGKIVSGERKELLKDSGNLNLSI